MAAENGSEFLGDTVGSADAAAEAMAAQMRANPGSDVLPSSPDAATSQDLDDLFADASKDAPPAEDPQADAKRESGIKDEAKPADEKPSSEKPEDKPAETKPADEKPVAKKGLLDDLLNSEKVEKKEKDPYEDIKLRPDASPKTRETFENMKATAREREKAANDRAAALEKTVSELSEKVKATEGKTATPEIENELKELRAFRAQFDTENDPEFKSKYDTKLEQNYQTVYAKLKEHGLKDEVIATLKSLSQKERDENIETFLSKIPTASRRLIESKLVDNVSVSEQRRAELNEVRAKADQILADRAKAPVETTQKLETEIATRLRPALEKVDWIRVKEIPASVAGEEKARLEKANEFALFAQEQLRKAIVDHSSASRAEAALAVPLAYYYKAQSSELAAENASLKKELEGIRAASRTSRTARTSASPNPVAPKVESKHEASAEDTIDELFAAATKGQ
jgi:hypothetical protein